MCYANVSCMVFLVEMNEKRRRLFRMIDFAEGPTKQRTDMIMSTHERGRKKSLKDEGHSKQREI